MSDESPPAKPPQHRPLEYFHSTVNPPLHPALLTLCTIAGVIIGLGVACTVVTAVAFPVAMKSSGNSTPIVIGIVVLLLGAGFIGLLIRKIYVDGKLALERRRRGPRFFLIGFLIGCGIACLLTGVCFTATGIP